MSSRNRSTATRTLLFAALVCGARPEWARAQDARDRVPTLTLNLSTSAEDHDRPDVVEGAALRDPRFEGRQFWSELRAAMTYSAVRYNPVKRKRFSVDLEGVAGARHYVSLDEVASTEATARISLQGSSARWRGNVFASGGYLPNYSVATRLVQTELLTPFDDTPLDAADSAISRNPGIVWSTRGQLNRSLTQRSALVFTGAIGESTYLRSPDENRTDANIGARYTRQVSKSLGIRLGYGHRMARYDRERPNRPAVSIEDLDVGIDFLRTLPALIPGMRFRFVTGSSISSIDGPRRFVFTALAVLEKQLTQSSETTLTYNRGIQIIDGLQLPLYLDLVQGAINVLPHRRVNVKGSYTYAIGSVGASREGSRYESTTADARVAFQISQQFDLFVGASIILNEFGVGVELPGSTGTIGRRDAIRAGLSLRVPMVHRRGSRGGGS